MPVIPLSRARYRGILYVRPPESENAMQTGEDLTTVQIENLHNAQRFVGLPIKIEHELGTEEVVGRVTASAIDRRDGTLVVDFELNDAAEGQQALHLMNAGLNQLSLSHSLSEHDGVVPLEVSIVSKGKRPGCYVTHVLDSEDKADYNPATGGPPIALASTTVSCSALLEKNVSAPLQMSSSAPNQAGQATPAPVAQQPAEATQPVATPKVDLAPKQRELLQQGAAVLAQQQQSAAAAQPSTQAGVTEQPAATQQSIAEAPAVTGQPEQNVGQTPAVPAENVVEPMDVDKKPEQTPREQIKAQFGTVANEIKGLEALDAGVRSGIINQIAEIAKLHAEQAKRHEAQLAEMHERLKVKDAAMAKSAKTLEQTLRAVGFKQDVPVEQIDLVSKEHPELGKFFQEVAVHNSFLSGTIQATGAPIVNDVDQAVNNVLDALERGGEYKAPVRAAKRPAPQQPIAAPVAQPAVAPAAEAPAKKARIDEQHIAPPPSTSEAQQVAPAKTTAVAASSISRDMFQKAAKLAATTYRV